MSKHIADLKIIDNKHINNDFIILELSWDHKLPEMKPGQFVQVKVEGSPETFLRRPLSIHDVDYGKNTFKLLIQLAGKGTQKLSTLKNGDNLNIIFPLGNTFTIPSREEKILLVGGGCGVAPLLFLAKTLKSHKFSPDILLGFRNKERIIEYEQYLKIGRVFITTEDGSVGEKGYITNHTILQTNQYHRVYCCGPDSMMRAVADWAVKNNVECEVSLENLMACGIGACLCCVVDTVKGNVCTCVDGPVFNIKDLKW
ncbi:MAG TPA: dihydroorotate dehydrogenase electron transfer subunit [Bacteroidales bacterium]|nr:dihydroorotate dehydrogenase electron transfer subunit [Bacteroidales bacterium]